MAQLPADRTKLAQAQGNMTPTFTASSQKLKDALTEAYDTVDLLNQKVNDHGAAATLPHADKSVTRLKLADKVVGAGQLDDAAVGQSHHQDNGIPGRAIGDNVILQRHMSDNSVGSAEIQAGAVTATKIPDGTINSQHIDAALLASSASLSTQAEFDKRGVSIEKFSNLVVNGDWITAVEAAETSLPNGGKIRFPTGTWNFNTRSIVPKNNIIYEGMGLGTILQFGSGISGFKGLTSTFNVAIRDIKLVGTGVTNAAENGIELDGGTVGFPKLNLSNLQIQNFGNNGLNLTNCWDSRIEKVNVSGNQNHGVQMISCNSADVNIVAFQNKGKGILIQSMSNGRITGTSQENYAEGIRAESLIGSTINMYLEQNGHSTAVDDQKSELVLTQRVGYVPSTGNEITVFALGGRGSVNPTYETKYGVYANFAYKNLIIGNFGGHLDSNLYFTSNSKNNKVGAVEHVTGLPGGDTPNKVTDNGTMNGYVMVSTTEENRIESLSFASQATARSITFAKPFTATPRIVGTVVSSVDNTTNAVKISNVTATGFDFVVTDGAGAFISGKQCNFIVMGQ